MAQVTGIARRRCARAAQRLTFRPVAGLRRAALILLAAGAFGSVGVMGFVGRHQRSVLLLVLFTVWVLSPFAALAVGVALSNRWSVPIRRTLYTLTIVVALGSLAGTARSLSALRGPSPLSTSSLCRPRAGG